MKRFVLALLLVVWAGTLSCADGTDLPDGPNGPPDPPVDGGSAIVSNPMVPVTATTSPETAALVVSTVAYVSLPPGTYPGGRTATITNRQTGIGLTTSVVDGGWDPVAVAAVAGDTLSVTVDTGAEPAHFLQPVPELIRVRVVRTDPPSGKRDVPLNLRIRVVFSEPVAPASVTGASLQLELAGAPVAGTVSVSASGWQASFQPAADLLPGTEYTISVSDAIQDSDGSRLDAPVQSRFTTGAQSGRAVALQFSQQPVNTFLGAIMPASVVVSAIDASGQVANGFTGAIHLSLGTNPGGGSLSGNTTGNAAPSAEFNDLRIKGAGRGYTLVATSEGLSSATSSAFDVIDPGPVRNMIAFYSYGQGIVAVSTVDGATGVLVPEPPPGEEYVREPAWAPDGRRLAFARSSGGYYPGAWGVFLVNADGSGVTDLNQEGEDPAWSPDGERIAFTSTRDDNREVYLMNPDGSGIVRLTNDPGDDYAPAWSPNGARLVYVHDTTLHVMNADGTGVTSLNQVGNAPAWSPDGTRIAFSRQHEPSVIDIYVIDADGSGLTNLTNNQSPGAYSYSPTWSPDGSRIAYSHTPDADNEPTSINIMRADGSGAGRFSPPIGATTLRSSLGPAWSP